METAAEAESGAVDPEEALVLSEQRKQLELRMKNATKPSLVVADLTESARQCGLAIRGIQPLRGAVGRGGVSAEDFPRYRVSVTGNYRAIARYMQRCPKQDLPARVVACRITRSAELEREPNHTLSADITFEAFQPVGTDQKKEGQS